MDVVVNVVCERIEGDGAVRPRSSPDAQASTHGKVAAALSGLTAEEQVVYRELEQGAAAENAAPKTGDRAAADPKQNLEAGSVASTSTEADVTPKPRPQVEQQAVASSPVPADAALAAPSSAPLSNLSAPAADPRIASLRERFRGLRVDSFVDQGRTMEVALVTVPVTGRQMALKAVRLDTDVRPSAAWRRLEREARRIELLGSIDPELFPATALPPPGHNEGAGLLVEYVPRSLRNLIFSESGLGDDHIRRYLGDSCKAVQTMHDQGLQHNDLKPSALRISASDRVKVVDLGDCPESAKEREMALADSICLSGSVTAEDPAVCSLLYAAPEQLTGRKLEPQERAAVDVYQLGKILYVMLTGEEVLGFPDRFPGRSAKYRPLLEKALSRDPNERHQSPLEFFAAFEDVSRTPSSSVGEGPGVALLGKRDRAAAPLSRTDLIQFVADALKMTGRDDLSFTRASPEPLRHHDRFCFEAGGSTITFETTFGFFRDGRMEPEEGRLTLVNSEGRKLSEAPLVCTDCREMAQRFREEILHNNLAAVSDLIAHISLLADPSCGMCAEITSSKPGSIQGRIAGFDFSAEYEQEAPQRGKKLFPSRVRVAYRARNLFSGLDGSLFPGLDMDFMRMLPTDETHRPEPPAFYLSQPIASAMIRGLLQKSESGASAFTPTNEQLLSAIAKQAESDGQAGPVAAKYLRQLVRTADISAVPRGTLALLLASDDKEIKQTAYAELKRGDRAEAVPILYRLATSVKEAAELLTSLDAAALSQLRECVRTDEHWVGTLNQNPEVWEPILWPLRERIRGQALGELCRSLGSDEDLNKWGGTKLLYRLSLGPDGIDASLATQLARGPLNLRCALTSIVRDGPKEPIVHALSEGKLGMVERRVLQGFLGEGQSAGGEAKAILEALDEGVRAAESLQALSRCLLNSADVEALLSRLERKAPESAAAHILSALRHARAPDTRAAPAIARYALARPTAEAPDAGECTPKTRREAIKALGTVGAGEARACEILLLCTQDPDGTCRAEAVRQLKNFPSFRDRIEKALASAPRNVLGVLIGKPVLRTADIASTLEHLRAEKGS